LREAILVTTGKEGERGRRSQVESSAVIDYLESLRVKDRNANVDDVELGRGRRIGVRSGSEVELGRFGIRSSEDESSRVGGRIGIGSEDKPGDGTSESRVEEGSSDLDETGDSSGRETTFAERDLGGDGRLRGSGSGFLLVVGILLRRGTLGLLLVRFARLVLLSSLVLLRLLRFAFESLGFRFRALLSKREEGGSGKRTRQERR